MKFNPELAKTILEKIELSNHDPLDWMDLTIDNFSKLEISYHVKLMQDEGLLEAQNLSTSDGTNFAPKHLTVKGHAFLEAAKKDNLWNAVKQKTAGLATNVFVSILQGLAQEKIQRLIS